MLSLLFLDTHPEGVSVFEDFDSSAQPSLQLKASGSNFSPLLTDESTQCNMISSSTASNSLDLTDMVLIDSAPIIQQLTDSRHQLTLPFKDSKPTQTKPRDTRDQSLETSRIKHRSTSTQATINIQEAQILSSELKTVETTFEALKAELKYRKEQADEDKYIITKTRQILESMFLGNSGVEEAELRRLYDLPRTKIANEVMFIYSFFSFSLSPSHDRCFIHKASSP
jgi:hypothetical protein